MKKLYVLLLLACLSFTGLKAQTYHPLLDSINIWQYTSNYIPVRLAPPAPASAPCNYPIWFNQYMVQYANTDTVLDSITYKKVETIADFSSSLCTFGYVREDTAARKVYFRDNANTESVMYDFSMQVGDSILRTFNTMGMYANGWYKLDSIVNINIHAGSRRAYYLNTHVPFSYSLIWIEGVGNNYDMFYTYHLNMQSLGFFTGQCNDLPHDNFQFLTCFDHTQKIYFDSCARAFAATSFCFYYQDSCNYWNICSDIAEYNHLPKIDVFPNPAQQTMTVSIEMREGSSATIFIRDIAGRSVVKPIALQELSTLRHDEQIDISKLNSGVYLIECQTENGSVYRKVVVQ